MKKTMIALLILTTASMSCKDKKDLAPAGISEKHRIAFIQQANNICVEMWAAGTDDSVKPWMSAMGDLAAMLNTSVVSCDEFKKKAVGACVLEYDPRKSDNPIDVNWGKNGITSIYMITYATTTDKRSECNATCRPFQRCEYKQF